MSNYSRLLLYCVPTYERTTALTALRNQLSIKSNEVISAQDERLLLSQHWMELAPGAQDLLEVWEGSNQVCEHNQGDSGRV